MKWLKKENPLCIKTETAVKLSRWIFFATYAFYLIFRTISETTYKYEHSVTCFTYGTWICCFLALLSIIFLCRYTVGQIVGILLLFVFYAIVLLNTQQQGYLVLQSLIIVFACRQVKWKHLIQFSFVFYILLILAPAFMEYIKILPAVELYRGDSQRFTLGFSHPNVLGGYCLCLVIIWLLLRYDKLKVYDYIAWVLIAAFLWIVPNSKTSTLLVLIICLITFIFKQCGDKIIANQVMQSLCLCFGWMMAAFSIIASYFYDSNNMLYVTIDRILFTKRLSYAHEFLNEYPTTLFGQNIKTVSSVAAAKAGTQPHILDNFYIRQLVNLGVVSLIIVLVLFTFLLYRAICTHDYAMLIGLLVILVYCVYENRGFNLVFNVLLFQLVYKMLTREEVNCDKSISNYSSV